MGIKERVKNNMEKIVVKGHQVDQEVISFVKEDYAKTLDDLGKGTDTIKETTLEYLEGVEEGLKAAGHKSGELVSKAAEALVEVSRDLDDRGVDTAKKIALEAGNVLNTALEKSKGSMDSVAEKTKEQMKNAYARLNEVGEAGKSRLKGVGEGIKAYAELKKGGLKDETRASLHKTADRSKVLIEGLARSTEEHSKALLSHSSKKGAEWLNKLADKIKPEDERR